MSDTETGVQAPAAGGQQSGQSSQQAGGQQGTPQSGQQNAAPQNVTVPLNVVQSVRQELSAEKERSQNLQTQLDQMRAMQQFGPQGGGTPTGPDGIPMQFRQPASQAQQQQAPDPFEGLGDDELVEVKHLRKMAESLRGGNQNVDAIQQAVGPLSAQVAKLQLQLQDPSYETTIKTYLPEMLNSNPVWTETIRRSPNPLMAALAVAKMSPKYVAAQQQGGQQQQAPDLLADLSKIIENATLPGNPAGMGGGSGGLSGNDRFKAMSDADFDAEVQRVLNMGPV